MFFFLKKKDPSRLERPLLHQDPHRTAKSHAGGYETPRPTFEGQTISGASIKDAPSPLLANVGAANEMNYTIDLAVSPPLFKNFICEGAKRRVDDGLA